MSPNINKNNETPISERMLIITDYDRMCIESNRVPKLYTIWASFSTWILLAGFLVFPGTFTRLRNDTTLTEIGRTGQVVQAAVQYTPLIGIAAACCLGGAVGMYLLWRRWNQNYDWLLNNIFT